MSSWFDYDDEEYIERASDINDEVWSDSFLRLAPKTFLWAYLHYKDLTQDYIKVTREDISNIRYRFINCGYPLVLKTFNEDQLIKWMDHFSSWIVRDPDNYYYGWIVKMNEIADVDTLTDKEINILQANEHNAREFLTMVNLNIDLHKLYSQTKTRYGICPRWLYGEEPREMTREEINSYVKTWKHVPSRYQK